MKERWAGSESDELCPCSKRQDAGESEKGMVRERRPSARQAERPRCGDLKGREARK